MGAVTMTGPPQPQPRPGDTAYPPQWCAICLCEVKHLHWKQTERERKRGAEAPGGARLVIGWPGALTARLQVGEYRTVAPETGTELLLCWDHVAGLDANQAAGNGAGGGLVTAEQLPPGLRRGKG